jgi:hypothetical protein
VKDFTLGRHENRLHVLFSVATNARARLIAGSMANGHPRRRIAFGIGISIDETIV